MSSLKNVVDHLLEELEGYDPKVHDPRPEAWEPDQATVCYCLNLFREALFEQATKWADLSDALAEELKNSDDRETSARLESEISTYEACIDMVLTFDSKEDFNEVNRVFLGLQALARNAYGAEISRPSMMIAILADYQENKKPILDLLSDGSAFSKAYPRTSALLKRKLP